MKVVLAHNDHADNNDLLLKKAAVCLPYLPSSSNVAWEVSFSRSGH